MAASARGARAPLAAGKGFSRETSVRNARRAVVPARRAVGGMRKTASVGSDANSVTRGVRARADGRDGLEARGTSSVAASADETTGVKARESVVARASGDAGDAVASPAGPSLDSILRSKSGFTKILCANRGEIAVRVFRAGTELGMKRIASRPTGTRLMNRMRLVVERRRLPRTWTMSPSFASPRRTGRKPSTLVTVC
jgi:hypothetical protein